MPASAGRCRTARLPPLPVAVLCLTLPGGPLLAQLSPVGAEQRVNTTTAGWQSAPRAALSPSGAQAVAWPSGEAAGSDVFLQLYDRTGAPLGGELRVNSYLPGCQAAPDLCFAGDGTLAVVWQSDGQDGSGRGVYAQRFAADGTPLGGELPVNVTTAGDQQAPRVACDATGSGYTVVWESAGQDGDGWGVYARRFDATGPLGGEVPLAAATAGDQRRPVLAVQPTGERVAAWETPDGGSPGGPGISLRRFDAALAPLAGEVRANATTAGWQSAPALAVDGSGNVTVAWESASGIWARRFDRALAALGGEFRVDSTRSGSHGRPAVTAATTGDVLIAWEAATADQGGPGVFAQLYDILAQPRGGELRGNSFQPGAQRRPALAAGPSGAFVAVWESLGQDGDGAGVYLQRYALPGLDFYTVAPCRVFDTRTTNRLVSGLARTFSVAGLCGIPATARAVSVNVTALGATSFGNVALYPGDAAPPGVSSVNFQADLARANNAILPLARSGAGAIAAKAFVAGNGDLDLLLDVNGYFQ